MNKLMILLEMLLDPAVRHRTVLVHHPALSSVLFTSNPGRSQEFELFWAMSKINELQKKKKKSEYEYAKVT